MVLGGPRARYPAGLEMRGAGLGPHCGARARTRLLSPPSLEEGASVWEWDSRGLPQGHHHRTTASHTCSERAQRVCP